MDIQGVRLFAAYRRTGSVERHERIQVCKHHRCDLPAQISRSAGLHCMAPQGSRVDGQIWKLAHTDIQPPRSRGRLTEGPADVIYTEHAGNRAGRWAGSGAVRSRAKFMKAAGPRSR
jgi:hypothetical protein